MVASKLERGVLSVVEQPTARKSLNRGLQNYSREGLEAVQQVPPSPCWRIIASPAVKAVLVDRRR
jgi:hypothetical protein